MTTPSQPAPLTPEQQAKLDAHCESLQNARQCELSDVDDHVKRGNKGIPRECLLDELLIVFCDRAFAIGKRVVEKEVAGRLACDLQVVQRAKRIAADKHRPTDGVVQYWMGRYEFQKRLGCGGFGRVGLYHDRLLEIDVAIKLPRSPRETTLGIEALGETKKTLQVRSTRVIQVKEVGYLWDEWDEPQYLPRDPKNRDMPDPTDPFFSAYRPAIIMEHADGESLHDRIRDQPWDLANVVSLFPEIALGVGDVHKAAIVHRDLKPQNILYGADGKPRVSDFGLAESWLREGSKLIGGTPLWMAPEVLAGWLKGDNVPPDATQDIWSLGVILYQLLTGKHPFCGSDWKTRIMTANITPVHIANPLLNQRWHSVVSSCLHSTPDRRCASIDDLLTEFDKASNPYDTTVSVGRNWPNSIPQLDESAHVFVGRQSELDQLRRILVEERRRYVVIAGFPGVGKTSLMRHFLSAPETLTWFPGGIFKLGINQLDVGVAAQFTFTGLPKGASLVNFLNCLSPDEPTLLVLDGVQTDIQIQPLVSQNARFQVLFTSRLQDFPSVVALGKKAWDMLVMEPLPEQDAITLLGELIGDDDRFPHSLRETLAAQVEYLPLALSWIGHLYHAPICKPLSAQQFLKKVRGQLKGDRWRGLLQFAIDSLQSDSQGLTLLQVLSCFNSKELPESELCEIAALSKTEFDNSMNTLMSLGVVEYGASPTSFNVHTLIHEAIKSWVSETDHFEHLRSRAVSTMVRRLFAANGIDDVRPLLPHINHVITHHLTHGDSEAIDEIVAPRIPNVDLSLLNLALPGRASVELWSRLVERSRGRTTTASGVYRMLYGNALLRVGRTIDAESELKFAVDSLANTDNDVLYARALSLYGDLLRGRGALNDAIRHLDQAFAIYEQIGDLGRQASALRKLGQAHESRGTLRTAYAALTKAREIHSQSTGSIDNDIAYDLCRMGALLQLMGHYNAAEAALREALVRHERGSGADSAFCAYDLNRLAELLKETGNVDEAVECLEQALQIHERFYGAKSSNVAIDKTRLAEAYALQGRFDEALDLIDQALHLHDVTSGSSSPSYAYDCSVKAKVLRLKAANSPTERDDLLRNGCRSARTAVTILEDTEKQSDLHLARAWHELGLALSILGDQPEAASYLWKCRAAYSSAGLQHRVSGVSQDILNDTFVNSSRDWARSALVYASFLNDNPDSLFHKLAGATLDRIKATSSALTHQSPPRVLDLFCGTGILASQADHVGVPMVVRGLDCSEMISVANDELHSRGHLSIDYRFSTISAALATTIIDLFDGERPDYVVLGMSLFQFDPRDRHLLLQCLIPAMRRGTRLLLTTSSADFEFPCKENDEINATNPFKELVYKEAARMGVTIGRPLSEAVAPTHAKDTIDSLSWFLEAYGFAIETRDIPKIDHVRSVDEHAAFTKLPVISQKVFASELPSGLWDRVIENHPGQSDRIVGTCFEAVFEGVHSVPPLLFSDPWDFPRGNIPIRYAVAGVVRDASGNVLIAKRGGSVRDFTHEWSLPSAMAEEGYSLIESLEKSLDRHLATRASNLRVVSVRIAPRRDDEGSRWIIVMCLVEGVSESELRLQTDKYEEAEYRDERNVLDTIARQARGDCFKSYRDLMAHRDVKRLE